MKNIPIIGKFLAIIAIFGLFAIGVAIYATSQMRQIDTKYTSMVDHQWAVGLALARASRHAQSAHVALVDLLASNSDEGNRMATEAMAEGRRNFDLFMDEAIKAAPPEEVEQLRLFKSRLAEAGQSLEVRVGIERTRYRGREVGR